MLQTIKSCFVAVVDLTCRLGKKAIAPIAAVGTVVSLGTQSLYAQVTLTDIGVDVSGTATAIGTSLGQIVASTITIFGAFLVVRYGLMWIKKTVK